MTMINRRNSQPVGISKAAMKALTKDIATTDGFNNFFARLGMETNNLAAYGRHTQGNIISRNHVLLEFIYRSSWIAGQVVDTVAEDMTKEGISMYSKLSPDKIQEIQSRIVELGVWSKICSNIKWGRLYGGSIAVILIDGADYSKPLDVKKIAKDSFKGLAVFDRWQVEPSFNDLITQIGPDMGKPKFYTVLPAMETLSGEKIHHTRVIRHDGIEMPYYQKKLDNTWGMSVIERMYDRLLAFDSATQGAAQLLYKAHLRVVQIEGLRQALAMGGAVENAVIKQFQYIRLMQSNEGITLLDSKDTFSTHGYQFSGLSDILIQFGQQVSGAVNIPLVRLFGQSPSGFSTGDTDLRNYYDNISKLQESTLRTPIYKILDIMSMSVHGHPLPDDFEYSFNSLWRISEVEKSQIAVADANTVNTLFQSGIYTKKIALKEIAQHSHTTGRGSNISDEDIKNAVEEPPEHQGMMGGQQSPEVATEAKPDHDLSLQDLRDKLKSLPGNNHPEQDDKETSLESLENELNALDDRSLDQLEKELNNLDAPSLEQLEKELQAISNGEKTLSELGKELRQIGLTDPVIATLEKQLESLKLPSPPKKMTHDGFFKRAVDAFKSFFTLDKKEKWITIKGKEGYRKVKLNEQGEIIGGDLPKSTHGKTIAKAVKTLSAKSSKKKESNTKTSQPNKKININKLLKRKANKKGEAIVRRTKRTENHIYVSNINGKLSQPLPKYLKGTPIPPSWKHLLINPKKNDNRWMVAFDDNGKVVGSKYNDEHIVRRALKLDIVVHNLNKNLNTINKQLEAGQKDKATYQKALIAKVVSLTGARIGSSEKALGQKGKTFGVSTLEGKHIVVDKGGVKLDFIGKDSIRNIFEIKDKPTAKALLDLKKKAGDKGKLFQEKYNDVLKYVKQLDGGNFTPKNFRSKIGSDTAIDEINSMKAPTNPKEYKKAMKQVAIKVSERLNNTPGICLKNYIMPSVWTDWKIKAGVD